MQRRLFPFPLLAEPPSSVCLSVSTCDTIVSSVELLQLIIKWGTSRCRCPCRGTESPGKWRLAQVRRRRRMRDCNSIEGVGAVWIRILLNTAAAILWIYDLPLQLVFVDDDEAGERDVQIHPRGGDWCVDVYDIYKLWKSFGLRRMLAIR